MRHFIKFMIALSLLLGANVASALTLAKHLTLNNCADNEICVARIQYDFATDGGAAATYDIATAGQQIVIINFWTKVLTPLTSATNVAMINVGDSINSLVFLNPTTVTNFISGFIGFPFGSPVRSIALGNKAIMTVGGESLTAGKVEFVIQYYKP